MHISDEDFNSKMFENLVLDGEAVVSVTRHPEFLVLARAILLSELPDLEVFSISAFVRATCTINLLCIH